MAKTCQGKKKIRVGGKTFRCHVKKGRVYCCKSAKASRKGGKRAKCIAYAGGKCVSYGKGFKTKLRSRASYKSRFGVDYGQYTAKQAMPPISEMTKLYARKMRKGKK